MKTIELNLPDNVEITDYDLVMMVAAKLYEDGKLSAGQAAEMVGISKRTFIELLGKFGVSIFTKDVLVLQSDIANA